MIGIEINRFFNIFKNAQKEPAPRGVLETLLSAIPFLNRKPEPVPVGFFEKLLSYLPFLQQKPEPVPVDHFEELLVYLPYLAVVPISVMVMSIFRSLLAVKEEKPESQPAIKDQKIKGLKSRVKRDVCKKKSSNKQAPKIESDIEVKPKGKRLRPSKLRW